MDGIGWCGLMVGEVFGIDFCLVGCHKAQKFNVVVFQHIPEFVHHPDVLSGPFAGAVVGLVLVDRLDAVVVAEGFGIEQPAVLAGGDEMAGGLVEETVIDLVVKPYRPLTEAEVLTAVLLDVALVFARGEVVEVEVWLVGGEGDARQRLELEGMPFFLHEDEHKPNHRQEA